MNQPYDNSDTFFRQSLLRSAGSPENSPGLKLKLIVERATTAESDGDGEDKVKSVTQPPSSSSSFADVETTSVSSSLSAIVPLNLLDLASDL